MNKEHVQQSKEDWWECKCGSMHKGFPYKCPVRELKEEHEKSNIIINNIPALFLIGLPLGWIGEWLPFNVKDGYSANWGMLLMAVGIIAYFVYLLLYRYGKVKGRFVLRK